MPNLPAPRDAAEKSGLEALLDSMFVRCCECGHAPGELPNALPGDHLRELADVAARSIVHEFYDPDNSWVTKYGWEKHLSDTIHAALRKAVAEMAR